LFVFAVFGLVSSVESMAGKVTVEMFFPAKFSTDETKPITAKAKTLEQNGKNIKANLNLKH